MLLGAGFFFWPMSREKRTAQVKAHITPTLREQLELFVQEEGGTVMSMSDYLFGMIEEHVALKSIRITRQKVSKRIGTQ